MKHSIIESKTRPGQYYIQWPDGVLSKDTYNLTHAKNNCRELAKAEEKNKVTYSYFISDSGRGILNELGVRNMPPNRPLLAAQSLTGKSYCKV